MSRLQKPLFEPLEPRALLATHGLAGTYFDNSDLTGKTVSRTDSQINFQWANAPISGIGRDTFSVRWTGKVTPKFTQKYTFYVTSDDGARLWVNHKLLIDHWTAHSSVEDKGSISLTAGKAYDLQLEFFDKSGGATAKLKWSSSSTPKATVPSSQLSPASQNLLSKLDDVLIFAGSQLKRTISEVADPNKFVVRTNQSDGKWKTVPASDWTSGFLAGCFWQLYQTTGNSYWSTQAKTWTLGLKDQTSQEGDLAFRFLTSYKPLYELTQNPIYRQVLLDAAASKNSHWNETVGAFQTTWRKSANPQADFGVLMDQTTDLELMLWASKQTNNQTYYDRAVRHVRNVIDHLVRSDGSTFQWGYFNSASGQFVAGETYQGFSDSSTWARGQAWAILSFATVAGETGLPDVLAAARKVADYFIAHLPSDSVPYWDFNSPDIPSTFRDSSAAAIAADGMLKLSKLITDPTEAKIYRTAAEKILTSLASSAYQAKGTSSRGILLHGAQNVPNNSAGNDVSLIFGDYYFLDAINRYRAL